VTGAGKGFCSGGDVKAMNEVKEGRAERPLIDKVAPLRDRVLLAMRDAPQPVIAAVNGAAAGAGMNLALGCDIRLASTAARFTQAFVKRGLHPDWGGRTSCADRRHGQGVRAHLHGRDHRRSAALRLGIVSAVHAPEELMPAAYDLARRIAAGPPIAIRLAKRALYHSLTSISAPRSSSRPSPRTSPRRRKTRARASAHSSRSGRRCSRDADAPSPRVF